MAEKGKYGDLIRKAKQEAKQDESQPSGKQDNQITIKTDDQITSEPDNQIAEKPDEKMVNLSVRVPESLRRHWAAEAKRSGITMTDVIIEALTKQFGIPDDQITR